MNLKTKLTKIGLLILCACFALQSSIRGQSDVQDSFARFVDQTAGLTADSAVRLALQNNGELLALISEAEAAEKMIDQADQRARSSVDTNGLQEVIGRSHRYTIQGSVPLELGGRRKARVSVAMRKAEIKRKAIELWEASLAARVRGKFGSALATALKLRLTESRLRSILETYRLIQARVKEGRTAPLEENMMLVEVNRLRAARETIESRVRISLLELRNEIGILPEAPLKLKGEFDEKVASIPALGALTVRAIAERPDLQMLRAMENLADAKIKKEETVGRLDASASMGYQRLRISDSVQFNYLVFGMKFILPQRNRNKAAIEASILTKEATEKRLAFGELTVRQEVAKAYTRYNSAVRAREITKIGVVGEAANNLNVVRQTYEFGENSLLVYLAEQQRYFGLEETLIDAQLEVYLAEVEIQRAINAPELIVR